MTNVNENITKMNSEIDDTNMLMAKFQLGEFLQEQAELKGRSTPKIDAYHKRRIQELTDYILNN